MHNASDVERQVGRMIDGAAVLGLPVMATEQYRKGLGETVPSVAERLKNAVCVEEKLIFSACIEPVRRGLAERSIRSVVVVGIEAHVGVLQSCLDLLEDGYVVAVAEDAIGSRLAADQAAGLSTLGATASCHRLLGGVDGYLRASDSMALQAAHGVATVVIPKRHGSAQQSAGWCEASVGEALSHLLPACRTADRRPLTEGALRALTSWLDLCKRYVVDTHEPGAAVDRLRATVDAAPSRQAESRTA